MLLKLIKESKLNEISITSFIKKLGVFIMKERIIGLDNLLEELNGDILRKSDDAKYVGIATVTRRDLEKLKAANHNAKIRIVGTLTFSEDVTPELARETIESVKVRGTIKASPEVQGVLNTLINVK